MYLKSIEVQGFKSFAQKIKFEFHNGITGIVGPNGSGKSNVADAVRWVFGEQSAKQLRSSNMQDVIFAGTQIRKPQSFAEVSITLNNEDRSLNLDFDEVTVTRKVYRMGESEYRLNGNLCRLKDIYELFYDTGIGKEGYSIIGQGQVDKILSAKAEERRELFDEACGIVKFKKRKAVAEKKLDSERQNMIRVTDILSELERQVGPLKKQSEDAKEYLKLRDELRSYDINAFLIDSRSLEKTLTGMRESLSIANENMNRTREEAEALKQEYAEVDSEINALDEKIEDIREKLSKREAEKAELESSLLVFREKIHSEEAGILRFKTRISEIEQENTEKQNKIRSAEEENTVLTEELKDMEVALASLKEKISSKETEIALYQESMDSSTGQMIDLLHERSEVSAKLKELETILSQNDLRMSEYQDKITSYGDQKNALEEEKSSLQKRCNALLDDLEQKNQELQASSKALGEAEENLKNAENTLNDLKQQIQVNRAKLESLKAIQERYEGFQPAVRSVMDEKKRNSGIFGTVSDLIRVDTTYRTLIETALGGNYQNIIVDTEDTAKSLVQYLKENRLGRATFLPLDSIRSAGGISDAKILNEKGVIGTADTLVSCHREFMPAIRYLLNRFLAVDTMEHGLSISRKYNYSVRIVTLDGEFLNIGGSITGGSYKSKISILGRSEEIASLESEIDRSKKQIESLEKNCVQFRQLKASASLETEDLEEEIGSINLSLAETKARSDALYREILLIENEKKEIENRIQEMTQDSSDASGKRNAILEAKASIDEANLKSSDSAGEMKNLKKAAEESLAALRSEDDTLRLKYANAEQRALFLTESVLTMEKEAERLSEDRNLMEKNILDAETAMSEFEATIADLQEKIEEAKGGDSGLRSTYSLLNGEKDALARSQKVYFDKRESLSSSMNDLDREIVRLESGIEKNEEKLASLTEYLWAEYELSPSEAEAYASNNLKEEKPSEIRRHANELKSAIKNLGSVNVSAIEQYKEISERYEFLNSQYEDLKAAEQSLVGIIQDLDNGMRKQFLESFEMIRTEFDQVFKDLFGGGSGRILLNPDVDVIDSDITIISEPPGKKLQNMLQLSGGEKALTAIALIFAIQNLKPSPFCLLDEIEAALDDSNVVRFTNYLKKLSKNTQYIVITHRRGTMVATDRLYGITMQEKGVSTLVSVNLVEQELDA